MTSGIEMMEELLITKTAHSTNIFAGLATIKLDVSQSCNTIFIPILDYEALRDVISIKPARGMYDLLGCCDFEPGFAAFDHHYKSLIFLDFHVSSSSSNAVCHDVLCNNSRSSNH